METSNKISLLVDSITMFAIIATFIIYALQLKAMRGQLEASRMASENQNMLQAINFIQQPYVRNARRDLLNVEKDKPFEEWERKEKSSASIACGSYDIVGHLAKRGVVPVNILVETWGNSIRKCFNAALPLFEEYRKPENRGENFWGNFKWLYEEVNKTFPPDDSSPHNSLNPTPQ